MMTEHSSITDTYTGIYQEQKHSSCQTTINQTIASIANELMNDTVLSQKLTESMRITPPTAISAPIIVDNRAKIETITYLSLDTMIRDRLNTIPDYLSRDNEHFQSILQQAIRLMSISTITDDIHIRLQEISILIYQMSIITLYTTLWTSYWKSGLGQLLKPSSMEQQRSIVVCRMNISIWPKEIQRIRKSMNNLYENVFPSSMDLVHYHLRELDRLLRQAQIAWNNKANQIYGYHVEVEELLQTYVNEHLLEFQNEIQHQITLVTYDYQIEAIKQAFDRQNPTEYEKKLMKQTCLYRDEQETSEQELKFLEQRMDQFVRCSEQPADYSYMIHSTLVGSMENPVVRQQLLYEFTKIIEQATFDMRELSRQTAEEQRNRARSKYENQLRKLQSTHHDSILEVPLIEKLILERCRVIAERIQYVYKYKMECFRSKHQP